MYLVKLIKRVVIAVEKGNDHVSKNDETRLSLAHFLRTCAPTRAIEPRVGGVREFQTCVSFRALWWYNVLRPVQILYLIVTLVRVCERPPGGGRSKVGGPWFTGGSTVAKLS